MDRMDLKNIISSVGIERPCSAAMLDEDIKILRNKLLQVYGIGPETADTILLYALDKPTFVIDEYTKRFVEKYKLSTENKTYDYPKEMFEDVLPKDVVLYQNYHVLIIVDAKGKEASRMEKVII